MNQMAKLAIASAIAVLAWPPQTPAQILAVTPTCGASAAHCLQVLGSGTGGGTIADGTSSIQCVVVRGVVQPAGNCAATSATTASVTLTAVPDRRSGFWAWRAGVKSGLCPANTAVDCEIGTKRALTVSVANSLAVTAVFKLDAVLVGAFGTQGGYFPGSTGAGAVIRTDSPSSFRCEMDKEKITAGQDTVSNEYYPLGLCSLGGIYRGERVRLKAVADSLKDARFDHWSISNCSATTCLLSGNWRDTISFVLDPAERITVTAMFNWSPIVIEAGPQSTGGGTVKVGSVVCEYRDGKFIGPDPTLAQRTGWVGVSGCTEPGMRSTSAVTLAAVPDEHSAFYMLEAYTGETYNGGTYYPVANAMCTGIGSAYQQYCRVRSPTATFPIHDLNGPLRVYFLRDPVRIAGAGNGDGNGVITSSGSRMKCNVTRGTTTIGDSTCARGGFKYGDNITLTATPDQHSMFYGWSFGAEACRGGASSFDSCYFPQETITIPGEAYRTPVIAAFLVDPLRIVPLSTGGGTVTSDAGNLNCTIAQGIASTAAGSVCRTGGFARTAVAQLHARADKQSMFNGWYAHRASGRCLTGTATDCPLGQTDALTVAVDPTARLTTHASKEQFVGSQNVIALVMDTAAAIKPSFVANPIKISALGDGSGFVNAAAANIACHLEAANTSSCVGGGFTRGAKIDVTALAERGSRFDAWYRSMPAISCPTAPAASTEGKSVLALSSNVDCLLGHDPTVTVTIDKPAVLKASFKLTGEPVITSTTDLIKRPITPPPAPITTDLSGTPSKSQDCAEACFDATATAAGGGAFTGSASVEVDVVDPENGGDFRIVLRAGADGGHFIAFTRWGYGGRPRAQTTYQLANACDDDAAEKNQRDQFSAEYFLNAYASDGGASFKARSGTLTIDEISRNSIHGRFNFIACDANGRDVADTRVRGRFNASWQHDE